MQSIRPDSEKLLSNMNCCHYYLQTSHLPADPFIAAEMAKEKKQKGPLGLKALQGDFSHAGMRGQACTPRCQAVPGTGLPEMIRACGMEGPGWREQEPG